MLKWKPKRTFGTLEVWFLPLLAIILTLMSFNAWAYNPWGTMNMNMNAGAFTGHPLMATGQMPFGATPVGQMQMIDPRWTATANLGMGSYLSLPAPVGMAAINNHYYAYPKWVQSVQTQGLYEAGLYSRFGFRAQ